MKAKDVVKKIQAEVNEALKAVDEDMRERVRLRVVQHFIGIYFEDEVVERLEKRYRGSVPDVSFWTIKKEIFTWGDKLIKVLNARAIPREMFDRVVDCAIVRHNKVAGKLQRAESVALRAATKKKRDAENAAIEGVDIEQFKKEQPITLGDAVGVSEIAEPNPEAKHVVTAV